MYLVGPIVKFQGLLSQLAINLICKCCLRCCARGLGVTNIQDPMHFNALEQ